MNKDSEGSQSSQQRPELQDLEEPGRDPSSAEGDTPSATMEAGIEETNDDQDLEQQEAGKSRDEKMDDIRESPEQASEAAASRPSSGEGALLPVETDQLNDACQKASLEDEKKTEDSRGSDQLSGKTCTTDEPRHSSAGSEEPTNHQGQESTRKAQETASKEHVEHADTDQPADQAVTTGGVRLSPAERSKASDTSETKTDHLAESPAHENSEQVRLDKQRHLKARRKLNYKSNGTNPQAENSEEAGVGKNSSQPSGQTPTATESGPSSAEQTVASDTAEPGSNQPVNHQEQGQPIQGQGPEGQETNDREGKAQTKTGSRAQDNTNTNDEESVVKVVSRDDARSSPTEGDAFSNERTQSSATGDDHKDSSRTPTRGDNYPFPPFSQLPSDKTSTPRTQGQSALSDSSFQWSSIHFTCFVGLQPQGIQPEYNPKPSGGFMGSQTLHVSPSSSGKDGNASSQTSIPPLYIRPRGDSAEYSLVHDPSVSPLLAHRNSGEAGRRNESIAPPAHTTPDALQESKISTGASETRDGLFDSDVSKALALSQEDSGIEQTRLHGSHAILDPQSASQEDSAPAGGRHGLDVPLAPHPGHGQSGPGDDPSTDGSLSQDAGSVDAEGETEALPSELQKKNEKIWGLTETITRLQCQLADKEELERSQRDLQEKFEQSQRICSEQRVQLREGLANYRDAQDRLAESERILAESDVQLRGALARIDELELTLARDRDNHERELQRANLDLQDRHTQAERNREELQAELRGALEETAQAERTRDNHEREALTLKVRVHELSTELERMKVQSREESARISRLTEEKAASMADNDRLTNAVAELTEAKRQLEEQRTELELRAQRDAEGLQSEIQEKERRISALTDVIERHNRQLEDREEVERANRDLQDRLTQAERDREELQAELRGALGRTEQVERTLAKDRDNHERENLRLRVSMHDSRRELETAQEQISHLTEERDAARDDCARLTNDVGQLTEANRQLEDRGREMEARLDQTERERMEMETSYRVLEMQKRTAEDVSIQFGQQTTTLQLQIAQLQTVCQEKERQLQENTSVSRRRIEELTAQMRERERQVVPLEVEAQRARQETRNALAQLQDMQAEMERMRTTIADLRAEVERSASAVRNCYRKEEELRQEIRDKEAQVQRYIKETQAARRQVGLLRDELRRLRLRLD